MKITVNKPVLNTIGIISIGKEIGLFVAVSAVNGALRQREKKIKT